MNSLPLALRNVGLRPHALDEKATPDSVKEFVLYIESIKDDHEMAHVEEDFLHHRILEDIASGTCEDPKKCAEEALKSDHISFGRWCT